MAGSRPHEPHQPSQPGSPGIRLARPVQRPDTSALPRRVKHLIVLPGGAEPRESDPVSTRGESEPATGAQPGTADDFLDPDDHPDVDLGPRSGLRPSPGASPGIPARVRGGHAQAGAQAAALGQHEAPAVSTFRVKLAVISRSVTESRAPGMPFIIFASVLVSLALFGLVVLRVMVDQASFRVDELHSKVAIQQATLTQLRYADSVQEAPARIAAVATQLGMVPAVQPVVLGPGGVLLTPGSATAGGAAAPTTTVYAAGPAPRPQPATATKAAVPAGKTATAGQTATAGTTKPATAGTTKPATAGTTKPATAGTQAAQTTTTNTTAGTTRSTGVTTAQKPAHQ